MYEEKGNIYILDTDFDGIVEKQEGNIITVASQQYKIVQGYNDRIRIIKM